MPIRGSKTYSSPPPESRTNRKLPQSTPEDDDVPPKANSLLHLPPEIRQTILELTVNDRELCSTVMEPSLLLLSWAKNLRLVHSVIRDDISSVYKSWKRRLECMRNPQSQDLEKPRRPEVGRKQRKKEWLAAHPEALPKREKLLRRSLLDAWVDPVTGKPRSRGKHGILKKKRKGVAQRVENLFKGDSSHDAEKPDLWSRMNKGKIRFK